MREPLDDLDVSYLLSSLVEKSLVVYDEVAGRYRLLETVRDYAIEKLRAIGCPEPIQARHFAFYLEFSEDAEPQLQGAGQSLALARLEAEHDNLRAALSRAKDGAPERG